MSPVSLVRRAIPEVDRVGIQRELSTPEPETDADSIQTLLERAQELYGFRGPINDRINQIKTTLSNRVDARYDDNNQLTIFSDCNQHAYRDPEDNQRILVSDPGVGIKFRQKRTKTTKYKEIRRTISDEIARRRTLIDNTSQLSDWQRTDEDVESERTHQVYIEALEWVQDLFETRIGYTNRGDFVGGNAEEA